MSEGVLILLLTWAMGTVIWGAFTLVNMHDELTLWRDRREATRLARLALLAPIWPIALAVALARGTYRVSRTFIQLAIGDDTNEI